MMDRHWVGIRCEASGPSEASPTVAEASETAKLLVIINNIDNGCSSIVWDTVDVVSSDVCFILYFAGSLSHLEADRVVAFPRKRRSKTPPPPQAKAPTGPLTENSTAAIYEGTYVLFIEYRERSRVYSQYWHKCLGTSDSVAPDE